MKILGERAMNPYTEGVSELQMAKVKEALERVEIKYKAGGATARPKVLAAGPSAPVTRPMAKVSTPQRLRYADDVAGAYQGCSSESGG